MKSDDFAGYHKPFYRDSLVKLWSLVSVMMFYIDYHLNAMTCDLKVNFATLCIAMTIREGFKYWIKIW